MSNNPHSEIDWGKEEGKERNLSNYTMNGRTIRNVPCKYDEVMGTTYTGSTVLKVTELMDYMKKNGLRQIEFDFELGGRGMEFERIGGSGKRSQYSLYDYRESPYGETVMSVEVHHELGTWWFVGEPKKTMNKEHMQALSKLLSQVLSE